MNEDQLINISNKMADSIFAFLKTEQILPISLNPKFIFPRVFVNYLFQLLHLGLQQSTKIAATFIFSCKSIKIV